MIIIKSINSTITNSRSSHFRPEINSNINYYYFKPNSTSCWAAETGASAASDGSFTNIVIIEAYFA